MPGEKSGFNAIGIGGGKGVGEEEFSPMDHAIRCT
jgi:hypothetical protein